MSKVIIQSCSVKLERFYYPGAVGAVGLIEIPKSGSFVSNFESSKMHFTYSLNTAVKQLKAKMIYSVIVQLQYKKSQMLTSVWVLVSLYNEPQRHACVLSFL